ncbi:MAG: ribosome biogenesis/translation initiation ATPase RLI [Candidatus Bathyarchaeia archaeon]
MVRVATLDRDRCRPEDCGRLCFRVCPMVRNKIYAIKFEAGEEKPVIVEALCSGCGICVRKCPFKALAIVNLPEELERECSHRYGRNAFKLYRLPVPSAGMVTGLIGKNGIGKTTALRILSGEIQPNLGRIDQPPDWEEIISYYRGSLLQNYFSRIRDKRLKVVHKPQYVDAIPRRVKGEVGEVINALDERGKAAEVMRLLELNGLSRRPVEVLSGGECQRLAVAAAICREADVYIFDEPFSYLDVRQRVNAAKTIRSLVGDGKTVLVAEHDIAMLDYLSDKVCVFYGKPGVFGIVSHPHSVRSGINIYLDGYLPDDNMRFRDEPVKFHVKPPTEGWWAAEAIFEWGEMEKNYEGFNLKVKAGVIRKGEVVGVLGPNGIGKTTFVKLLAGVEAPSKGTPPTRKEVTVSYKPQYISVDYRGNVEALLREIAGENFETGHYKSEILQPLELDRLFDKSVQGLSGGELQKVAVGACLSREADLYLLDEPSAFLDVEERIAVARVIRRRVESRGAAAIVVEHDVVLQDFVADRLVIFAGLPGVEGCAYEPMTLRDGMNFFLRELGMTFRRDLTSGRPRVNKLDSRLDRWQKEVGEYYYISTRAESAE